jgi:CubicO group peptidase (beta-lactamase class C family)
MLAGCAHVPEAPSTDPTYADVGPRLEASLKRHNAAAVGISVIQDGKITWTGTFGEQAPGVPATAATMFNVASLAKPVTAEITMRLVSAGAVSLDEPISEQWVDPDIVDDPRHKLLTPRFALSHQTGFPNWRFQNPGKKLAFTAEPRSGFTYSGEGYEYLRRFLEKKTGKSFEALIAENVFSPLGMKSAAFSKQSWMSGRYAMPMDRAGKFKPADLAETGKLFVTTEDYAKFTIGVINQEGLTPAVATERQRRQVDIPAPAACKQEPDQAKIAGCPDVTEFGLGWITYRFGDRVVLSNSGNDWGEFAMVYIELATRNGLIIFVNGGNGVPVAMDAMALVDPTSLVAAFGRAQMGK